MNTNLVQLGISLASGLACLLPLCFQSSNFEDSSLRQGLSSKMYRDSAIMIIALVIPIALDTLADITNYSKDELPKGQERGTFLNINERILFLFGFIICPSTVFLSSNTPNLAFIYFCCNKSQLVISCGVIFTSLCRYKKEFWSVRITYILLTTISAGVVSSVFINNLYAKDPTDQVIFATHWVSWTFILFAEVLFFLCSGRWLFVELYPKIKSLYTTRSDKRAKLPGNLWFPLILNITVVASASLFTVLMIYFGNMKNWNQKALFLNNLAYILYLITYYYVMIRTVKYEVIQGLYALIDSKKSYVRYISHELRTPLNAACLG
jgi:hypothetical protein